MDKLLEKISKAIESNADVINLDMEYIPEILDALERREKKKIKCEFKQAPYDCNAWKTFYECPACGAEVDRYRDVCCHYCGQLLDLEDIND